MTYVARCATSGLRLAPVGTSKFEARICELVADNPDLAAIAEPLLIARRVLREQLAVLHHRLLAVPREDEVCRRLMTVPYIGRWSRWPSVRRSMFLPASRTPRQSVLCSA